MLLDPYVIYDASAGSGKTFTLVKEYLKLLLAAEGGQNFRKILAITFTNKAVNEMKHRILECLHDFSIPSESNSKNELFLQLEKELKLSPEILHKRARRTLKEILHNYAFFDISTIDKFNHRLIKTFAKDLKIPQNFEVVLDTELLLTEGVDRLIGNAKVDDQITDILIAFALEKIDESKSWNIAYDLGKVGAMLFNENHSPYLEGLKSKDLRSFLALQSQLLKTTALLKKELVTTAQNVLQLMEDAGLEQSDFKAGYFPKFMKQVIKDPSSLDFTAKWKQEFGNEALYNKSTPQNKKAGIDGLMLRFTALFSAIKQQYGRLSFLKNIYQNIVPITILNALQKEINTLLEERDQLPISAFNTLISEHIKDQPAPFIYERLGEKYKHYFIDEFQDTSLMQWSNLVPLISHALQSEDLQGNRGSLFLVGDAKQAIYRWRGGRSEQFLNLIGDQESLFGMPPKTATLGTNYRSYEEIVSFNNDFFTSTVPHLNNELYQDLFIKGNKQLHTNQKGGLVSIRFLEDPEGTKDLSYCEEVLRIIDELRKKQVPYRDICVLFRTKKQGVKVAEHLLGNKIPVISSESLLLQNNASVNFLVNLLKLSNFPSDLNIQYELLSFLSPPVNKHSFISQNLEKLPVLLASDFNFDLSVFNKRSVYDGLEYAIERFRLCADSNAYISCFLDEVLDIEQTLDTSIATFLTQWDKKKSSLSIPAPDNVNAVQLMTIHKAKGLEFPMVIFPFANTYIYQDRDPKIWVPAEDESLEGFKNVLVSKKKEMIMYHEQARVLYEEEQQKMELDAFNLLYVVLTRSIQGLFIVSEMDLTSKGEHKPAYFSGLFIHFLKEQGRWDPNTYRYDFGELIFTGRSTSTEVPHVSMPFIYTNKFDSRLSISTRAGELWGSSREVAISQGTLLHYGMSLILSPEDVAPTVSLLLETGAISANEESRYLERFNKITTHPALAGYFKAGLIIKNEQPLITKNGVILRPDRIVFDEMKVTILDYKTGKEYSSHNEQIDTYGQTMRSMGYTVENKILVYIDDKIKPVFI
ncbi:MAG: UvrD-helicase domain-containing protein [Eudoraea sp.]|nr:UvrD-helicase domain-containing protein [Eudoraea sp.]